MTAPADTLGLFPLRAVLVPGGALSLRVFEPRYLDLVRDCSRNDEGFGVSLDIDEDDPHTQVVDEAGATSAQPSAQPAEQTSTHKTVTAAFGTEARIEDFGTGEDGLLNIRVRGHRRFRVLDTRVRDNGLIVARVDWRDPDSDDELHPEHAVLGTLLQRLQEQAGGEHANAAPARYDNAAWIGWRLIELLPLADRQRQALLQDDDPHTRLDSLLALMPD